MSDTKEEKGLVTRMADKYGVDAGKFFASLKTTAFRQQRGKEVTNEQMMSLLIVADQYGLNPFTKEIYAFPGSNGEITPIVSVDGWSRIINNHKGFNGIEFRYSDTTVQEKGGKPCPEWVEAVIHRKDREHPTIVREWLDETYQHARKYPGPWQTHTKRMLRHKALIQCSRVAFGFSGIYDPDEAERIQEGQELRYKDMGNVNKVDDPYNANAQGQHDTNDDSQIVEAEIVYDEISDEQKAGMQKYLVTLLQRAAKAGAWAAAREHIEGRFSEGELQYAMQVLNEGEVKFEASEEMFDEHIEQLKNLQAA